MGTCIDILLGISVVGPSQHQTPQEKSSSELNTIHNGKEVYLTKGGTDIFRGKYESCPEDSLVHGETLGEDHGRFFITKVFKNASKWKDFDCDKHTSGAVVKWPFNSIRKLMRKDVHAQGTESRLPTLLARRNKNMTPEEGPKETSVKQRQGLYL